MAYTATQLIAAYTAANTGIAPDASTTALLTGYAAQTQSGQMSDATALSFVVNSADNTTAVANTAYQFFTGKTPSQAGLSFLVNSTTNPTDLNDPYYAAFNIENRYMNFAANLGLYGDGAAAFQSTYGSMTFSAFVTSIYEVIIGSSYVTAAGFNPAAAIADVISRQAAFVQTARDRSLITASSTAAQIDLATKAVVVGYLLVEGMKADLGIYAAGANNLTQAIINGTAQFNVNMLTVYSPLGGGVGQAVPGAASASSNLTTGIDSIPGTSGNDVFSGAVFTDSAATSTFSAADTVNGSGGSDTLNLTISKVAGGALGAVAVPAASLTSVETVNVRSLSTTVADVTTVSAASFSGTTAVNSDRSTNAVTITGLAAGASAGIIGDGSTTSGALTFGYAAPPTAATLNLSGGVKGGAVTISTAAPAVTVNSTGTAANTIGALALGGAATSLTIAANAALSTTGVTGFTGATASITVSGSAGATTATTAAAATTGVTLGALEGTVNSLNASGLTAGGVTAGIGANANINFTGGAGTDVVTVAAGTGAALAGSINGGGGNDTVVFSTTADLSALIGAKFTSFENLAFTSAAGTQTFNVGHVSGATSVQVTGSAGGLVLQGFAAAPTVTVSGSAPALTLQLANAGGGSDSASLNLNNNANFTTALTNTGVVVGSLTLGGSTTAGQVETLSINSGGSIGAGGAYNAVTLAASGAGPNFADPSVINVTGSVGLTLATGVLAHTITVNAQTATGGLAFNSAAGGAFAVNVNGTTANDTITLGAGQLGTIAGGAGADLVFINGASGAVTLAYTKAGDSLLDLTGTPGASGAGTANVGVMDNIQGFRSGTDKLRISDLGGGLAGSIIADKGAALSAAAVTSLLATATVFTDSTSVVRKVAQFDYAGGTMVLVDVNANTTYDSGDLVVFLGGVANIVSTDLI